MDPPKSTLAYFMHRKAASLQYERGIVLPSSTATTSSSELWADSSSGQVSNLEPSHAPLFFPGETPPATPDEVLALERQEADYILRIYYVLWNAFLDFRQTTWHTPIQDVHDHGVQTVVIMDGAKRDRWNGFWSTFPEARIRAEHNVYAMISLLTAMSCLETAHFKRLIEHLFEGMKVTLEEVTFRLKPGHHSTVFLSSTKSLNPCAQDLRCLRVTSHLTNRQWAIHLSSPQYGKYVPGTEWNDFVSEYIASDFTVAPFGTLARYSTAMSQTKGVAGMNHDLSMRAMQAFHATVDAAMEKKHMTWTNVLHKSDDDFMRHTDKILRVGNAAVQAFTKNLGPLTKRRMKAERYDKRHKDEWKKEHRTICKDTLYEVVKRESTTPERKTSEALADLSKKVKTDLMAECVQNLRRRVEEMQVD